MTDRVRLASPRKTDHLYEIEADKDGQRQKIDVEANNRDQAARLAVRAGYAVRSVNMTG